MLTIRIRRYIDKENEKRVILLGCDLPTCYGLQEMDNGYLTIENEGESYCYKYHDGQSIMAVTIKGGCLYTYRMLLNQPYVASWFENLFLPALKRAAARFERMKEDRIETIEL